MDVIENNPFRILGLPITASVREIDKRATELATYVAIGKAKTYECDFKHLPVVRTLDVVSAAKQKLHIDREKFRHSLFWYWNRNSVDDLALELLRDGNFEKAKAIWEKAVLADAEEVYTPVTVVEDLVLESDWQDSETEAWRTGKEEGSFVIESRTKSGLIQTVSKDFEDDDKWLIECDCEWMNGVEDFGFGIVFGKSQKSYTSFMVSANGQFLISRVIDSNRESLVPWTESDAIDGYGVNRLEVERDFDDFVFRINGEVVAVVERVPFFGNDFGFYVSGIQEVYFSNFRLIRFEREEDHLAGVQITGKNVSCAKNLSVLHLQHSKFFVDEGAFSFKIAVSLFEKFVSSDHFDEYVSEVAGKEFVLDWSNEVDYFTGTLVEQVRSKLEIIYGSSLSEFIESFSVLPEKNFQVVKSSFVSTSIQKINLAVSDAEQKRKADPKAALSAGKALVSEVENELSHLSNALGTSSIEYKLASDKVVDELTFAGIAYFNTTRKNQPILPLFEFAMRIAVTPKAIERAKENLRIWEHSILIEKIHKLIESSQSLRNASPENAVSVGQKLIADSKALLNELKDSAGAASEEYRQTASYLAYEIVQCGIDYFNSKKNDQPGLPLYQYAVSIAATPDAANHARANLESCKKWIENKDYLLCHFCGKNEPGLTTNVRQTMYLVTNRSYFPRSVNYSYGDVLVPRCLECAELHIRKSEYRSKLTVSVVAGVLGGLIGSAFIRPHLVTSVGAIEPCPFALTCAFFLGLAGWLLAFWLFEKVDLGDRKSESDIAGFKSVKERVKQGWTFSKPSA